MKATISSEAHPIPSWAKPSAMITWGDSTANGAWRNVPGQNGLIRIGIRPSDYPSLEAFISGTLQKWGSWFDRPCDALLVCISKTPGWDLSSSDTTVTPSNGWQIRHSLPPNDPATYRALGAALSEELPARVIFEFGNETDIEDYNRSPRDILFACHREFTIGVLSAKQQRVTALNVNAPLHPHPRQDLGYSATKPLLQDHIEWCAQNGYKVPAVTWHCFGEWWPAARQVQQWLDAAGASSAKQYVTEFLWSPFHRPEHDTCENAAFILDSQAEAGRMGVTAACTYIQDHGSGHLDGGLGMLSRNPVRGKPAYWAQHLLGQIQFGEHYPVTLDPEARGAGVGVLATDAGLLAWRFQRPAAEVWLRELHLARLPLIPVTAALIQGTEPTPEGYEEAVRATQIAALQLDGVSLEISGLELSLPTTIESAQFTEVYRAARVIGILDPLALATPYASPTPGIPLRHGSVVRCQAASFDR